MKNKVLLPILTCLFLVLFSATVFVSYSGNIVTKEVVLKSIIPVYDETSGVIVTQDDVTFNDKNQVVDYIVVIENTQDYDVKINNISLTTPTEEFLKYEVEGIQKEDILKANSTKEITVSLETMGIKGWGRNFSDELTANISFEKVAKEEVIPPKEEEQPKEETPEEDKTEQEKPTNKPSEGGESSKPTPQPEAPIKDEKELIKNVEKIEEVVVTSNTIELPKEIKVSVGEKLAIWIYSEPIFLGYFDVVVENGIKKIEGLEEALSKADIKAGEHNIVLVSNEETIGYIPVSINENKELITEDNKRDESIENPYTSDNGLLIVLIAATTITGVAIVIVGKNKVTKYMVFAIVLGSTLIPTNAEGSIELPITFNVNFESQNVMKPSGWDIDISNLNINNMGTDFWAFSPYIKNIYIQNEITEIEKYEYKFDVTEEQNKRVMAYLVDNEKNETCYDFENNETFCYDLYLQADGIIYPNSNMDYYFALMANVEILNNLDGLDTKEVTTMVGAFGYLGLISSEFKLEFGDKFDTSNVTNMSYMFNYTGYNSSILELDVSNFDISNVTDMSYMFDHAGYSSDKLDIVLTIKNPNTNINSIFSETAIIEGSKIKVNYTNLTKGIANRMVNTKSDGANVVLGDMVETIEDDGELSIGDEVEINGEYFNVVSQTEDTVTLLPQYNLGTDYKQSSVQNGVKFADTKGWEYTPGPKEIDIQTWSTNPKTYVNAYIEYLKEELGDDTVTGDLITLKDLEELGCTVPSDYASDSDGWNCNDSQYGWIFNGQDWWTRSAFSTIPSIVWNVGAGNCLGSNFYSVNQGVRPIITISKDALKKSFS